MLKYIIFIVAIVIALFYFMSSSSNQITYQPNSRIYAFGDSLTFGYGSSKSYPQFLEEILEIKIHNLGISGERTEQGLERLKKIFNKTPADIIILIHGGNDFLQKKPLSETSKNLEMMIQFLQNKNIKIVLIGMPNSLLGLLSSSHNIYAELADKYTLVYDGLIMPKLLTTYSLKSDNIHLNKKGYKILSQKIAKLFKKKNP